MMNDKRVIVPKLRFPDFVDEWELDIFENIFNFHQTNTFSRVNMNSNIGNIKNIHYGDVLIKYSYIVDDFSTMPFLNNDINIDKYSDSSYVKNGDIIISDTAEDDTAGKAIEVQNTSDKILSGLHTMLCRSIKDFSTYYLGYYLNSQSYREKLIPLLSGTKVLSISKTNIRKTLVLFPKSSEEQKKIGECLYSLDELITAENKKLDLLKEYKRGLLQKLFPARDKKIPEWRFPKFCNDGEWKKAPILDKVDMISGYAFASSEITEDISGVILMRGINITEGRVRHTKDIDRYYLGKTNSLEKYKLQLNDVVIGMDGSKVGKNSSLIKAYDVGSILVQRVARLRAKKQGDIEYIYQYINSFIFSSYVDKINTSSGIPHISMKQIQSFAIYFPLEEKEQQKIVSILSSTDSMIASQIEKTEQLNEHKKGLMQGLFPSNKGVM